ncbi:hypothetical protein T484DRAFT_3630209, partial [Baffinella frigidus]
RLRAESAIPATADSDRCFQHRRIERGTVSTTLPHSSTNKEARSLTGESSKMCSPMTPEDFINAFCSTQTSSFCDSHVSAKFMGTASAPSYIKHTEARSLLTGEGSKMSREYTPTTPVDIINAWCGTQTSSFSDSQMYVPRMYMTEAEDLLLCSLGATPRADDASANYKAHAGAARWLRRATVPLRGGRRGSECFEEETAPGASGIVLARCSSMTDCREAVSPW